MVIQLLSGTWDLETLGSQELESQKTGEQQIEETGCHGSKKPRWLFQVDACVPRNIQKTWKMGIAAPFDTGNRTYGNLLAEETRHRETRRPGRLGFKVSRK
ncbi:MAG: hypothetical protein ACXWOV_11980 [Isosphaeraceae bacterium]